MIVYCNIVIKYHFRLFDNIAIINHDLAYRLVPIMLLKLPSMLQSNAPAYYAQFYALYVKYYALQIQHFNSFILIKLQHHK